MKKIIWLIWFLISAALLGYFAYINFYSEDKSDLIIGEATHGHHQIELACEACHTDPLGGPQVLQEACVNCHGEDLSLARDDHPKKKFTDPRNANLAEVLDAKKCITCHTEHQLEQADQMGLTIAQDFCFHCHEDVGENRPTHKGLTFDTCGSAGCHNYHDNRALYEDFLLDNSGKPWLSEISRLKEANYAHYKAEKPKEVQPSSRFAKTIAQKISEHPEINQHWSLSGHAESNVGCASCHGGEPQSQQWVDKPGMEICQSCHANEVKGFTSGKHGMRLSSKLPEPLNAMTPSLARLEFNQDNQHQELTCNSCHNVHELNTQTAATESCLGCHADEHSLAHEISPHGELWAEELAGEGEPGSGVSCATCHMPRTEAPGFLDKEKGLKAVFVEHNQNLTLRPNEKMIRPVCMQCHSLEFSIDALADEALIKNNFNGKPSVHIESVDWAVERGKK